MTAPLLLIQDGTDDELDESLAIAAALCADRDPVVRRPVGILLKYAAIRDPDRVRAFLDAHEHEMPRPAVRLAREKL